MNTLTADDPHGHHQLPQEAVLTGMAGIFKLLADGSRLKIILSLLECELCVADIVQATSIEQSSVSHHLHQLRKANLVVHHRHGKQVYYRLADSHVIALLAVARDHTRESL